MELLIPVICVVLGCCAGYYLNRIPIVILSVLVIAGDALLWRDLVYGSHGGNAFGNGMLFLMINAGAVLAFLLPMWVTAIAVHARNPLSGKDFSGVKRKVKSFLFR